VSSVEFALLVFWGIPQTGVLPEKAEKSRKNRQKFHIFRNQQIQNSERTMKTISMNKETAENNWYVIDAEGKTLGRMAAEIAHRLRGKHKPEYTPHVDTGDYIVVVNAEKVSVTGKKTTDKLYHRHSGYPGGLKTRTFNEMVEKAPEDIITLAVKGMMPRTPLGRAMLRKLKVYAGAEHPHGAQNPAELNLA
jgi:large subunit ribosomal protein L13